MNEKVNVENMTSEELIELINNNEVKTKMMSYELERIRKENLK